LTNNYKVISLTTFHENTVVIVNKKRRLQIIYFLYIHFTCISSFVTTTRPIRVNGLLNIHKQKRDNKTKLKMCLDIYSLCLHSSIVCEFTLIKSRYVVNTCRIHNNLMFICTYMFTIRLHTSIYYVGYTDTKDIRLVTLQFPEHWI